MRMVGISLEVGLLRSEDSQVEVDSSSKDGVGTLIFDPHVVRILIVSFPEHQQRNANLQKRRSNCSGSIASPMIKSTKIWRGRRREFASWNCISLPRRESSQFIRHGSQISILILGIKYVFFIKDYPFKK